MTLSFYTHFPSDKGSIAGKLTNFKKKILAGVKIHTMRSNPHVLIGTYFNTKHGKEAETDKYYKVRSLQQVEFRYNRLNADGTIAETRGTPEILIDGRRLGIMEQIMLAINDGFDSYADFVAYFNKSGVYTLIHWTEYTYDGNKERLQAVNDKLKAFSEM